MKRIAVINQKGGVGKTTTTVNLGAALARRGYRVVMLDMDPQANLTVHVDKRPDLEGQTMTNLLVEDVPLKDLVQTTATANLFVVPSDTSLAGVEQVHAGVSMTPAGIEADEWRAWLDEIASQLTQSCAEVDPQSTDQALTQLPDNDFLPGDLVAKPQLNLKRGAATTMPAPRPEPPPDLAEPEDDFAAGVEGD